MITKVIEDRYNLTFSNQSKIQVGFQYNQTKINLNLVIIFNNHLQLILKDLQTIIQYKLTNFPECQQKQIIIIDFLNYLI